MRTARRPGDHDRSQLRDTAENAADSRPIGWAARAGLVARGIVWILIGVLGILLARGAGEEAADQKGAVRELLDKPGGGVLVGLLAVGFAGYALWQLSEAAFGVTGEGRRVAPRLVSLARAVAYLALTATAVSTLLGSRSRQSSQQESVTARLMTQDGGRWLVAAVGLVIAGIGIGLAVQGLRLAFLRYFRSLPGRGHRVVKELGRIGTTGRGGVVTLVGVLVVSAAVTFDPEKARGLDGALRTLLQQPYGTVLALVASGALATFGVFSLAEARYRRV